MRAEASFVAPPSGMSTVVAAVVWPTLRTRSDSETPSRTGRWRRRRPHGSDSRLPGVRRLARFRTRTPPPVATPSGRPIQTHGPRYWSRPDSRSEFRPVDPSARPVSRRRKNTRSSTCPLRPRPSVRFRRQSDTGVRLRSYRQQSGAGFRRPSRPACRSIPCRETDRATWSPSGSVASGMGVSVIQCTCADRSCSVARSGIVSQHGQLSSGMSALRPHRKSV